LIKGLDYLVKLGYIKIMRVLIACEESQIVCKAFRERGHEAYSCDIIDCSGGHPEWHIKDDVLKHLNDGWDLMIAHPPCTHLAVSGARYFQKKIADGRQKEAIEFFLKFTQTTIPKVAIENPVCIMSRIWREPTQIIQPYYFGDEFQKTTCLWLKNLPKLRYGKEVQIALGETKPPQSNIVGRGEFIRLPSGSLMSKWMYDAWGDAKTKSKTFPGIAQAMSNQWG
jgi:site-specific DNA-cytosine methylase